MSYSVYLGMPEKIDQAKEIDSFSKCLHEMTFELLSKSAVQWGRLSELKDYYEFINFSAIEVAELIEELQEILASEQFANNELLKSLFNAGNLALQEHLELFCYGED